MKTLRILITLSSASKPLDGLQLADLSGIPQSSSLNVRLEGLRRSAIVYVTEPEHFYDLTKGGEILARSLPKILDDEVREFERRYIPRTKTEPQGVRGGSIPAFYDYFKRTQYRLKEFQGNLNRKLKESGSR